MAITVPAEPWVTPHADGSVVAASGGSALWFASQSRGLGLTYRVLSVDIDPVTSLSDPDVVFVEGDMHDLSDTALQSLLKDHTGPRAAA